MRIGMVKALGAFGLLTGGLVAFPASSVGATQQATRSSSPLEALLAKLEDPAASEYDGFGYSVAVSGKTAVVGAPAAASLAGKAYIYKA